MKKLQTGIIVTRTKRRGVERIEAYTPLEWEFHKLNWWYKAKETINRFIK